MSAYQSPSQPTYRQEEVQQILQLAITRKTDQDELSRDQLWEIAAELDIDGELLQSAERDWLKQRQIIQKKREFNDYRREMLKYRVARYGIVNGFLIVLNVLSSGTLSWSMYILLLWGIKLSLDTWRTFQTQGEAYEQAFQRWNIKNEMKQSLVGLWDKIKQTWGSQLSSE